MSFPMKLLTYSTIKYEKNGRIGKKSLTFLLTYSKMNSVIIMNILQLRHSWSEPPVFELSRPIGREDYTFLHFFQSMEIEVGGVRTVTQPHACIFYAPHEPQWFRCTVPLTHDWMHLTADSASLLKKAGITENTIFYPCDPEFITGLFYTMEHEFYSDRPNRETLLQCKLNEFLILFSRACDPNAAQKPADSSAEWLREVRYRMLLHCDEAWPVERMAAQAGFSVSQFHLLYRRLFGNTPTEDLISARIRHAENLLQNTALPVGEIAIRCGYANATHFNRQFRAAVQMTPLTYRGKTAPEE